MANGKVILVVEDNDDIRETLLEILRDEGYAVADARNGAEALDWLREHQPPSLICLDLRMPVMDGTEFRIRQLADAALARIPTVVMSAINETAQQMALLRGCPHLRKPVDLEHLLATVAAACGGEPEDLHPE